MTDLCTTPACIHLASEILWSLAPNYTEIDPCTNFDELVCGNWAYRNTIPAGFDSIQALTATGIQIETTARDILEGSYPPGIEPGWLTINLTDDQVAADVDNLDKIQSAYNICMDYDGLLSDGLAPLAKFVKQIVKTFPATSGSKVEEGQTYEYCDEMGKIFTLFESFGIETTQRFLQKQNNINPEETHLLIIPPTSSDFPSTEEEILEYILIVSEIISAVHPMNITVKQAATRMKSVLELELILGKALEAASEEETSSGLDSLTPRSSISEVQKVAPQLNYEYVISQLAPEGYQADTLAVPYLGYYKNLSQILTETPPEVIQTFFIWKAVIALSPYIESEQTTAYNNFKKVTNGDDPESPRPRWQQCLSLIDNGPSWIADDDSASGLVGPSGLTWILSRFFLDVSYSQEAKDLTTKLVDYLKSAFLERVESKDWVSAEVKKSAAEKVRLMLNKVALPTDPNVLDPIVLQEYYSDAKISPSHADNALAFAKVNIAKMWDALGKPVNKGNFKQSALTTNAYQDFQLNAITLDAGIQQFPLYDINFPSYILFGGMGSVVGHEITHGFDNTGRLFDATGNMTTWWDKQTISEFTKRTECFIKQYGKFTITGPNGTQYPVDGEQTLGENIADAGGVVSSYTAWKKWESENEPAKSLPGLDHFTHAQLFFLKWGQSWCENTPPEVAYAKLSSDEHSPNSARIQLVMDNTEGFKEAFQCPQKKPVCELW